MQHRDTKGANFIRKMVPIDLFSAVSTNLQFIKIALSTKHNKTRYVLLIFLNIKRGDLKIFFLLSLLTSLLVNKESSRSISDSI